MPEDESLGSKLDRVLVELGAMRAEQQRHFTSLTVGIGELSLYMHHEFKGVHNEIGQVKEDIAHMYDRVELLDKNLLPPPFPEPGKDDL